MPTYTYACQKCAHEMNVFHGMNDSPTVVCEACGHKKTTRLLGAGAGLIFKGSGFYETDYKRNGGQNGSSKSGEKSEAKSESSTATKETKSDSKSASDTSSSSSKASNSS